MSYEIIDRPMPLNIGKPGRNRRYPWEELEVGQAFKIATPRSNGYTAAANKRYAPKVFAQGKEPDGSILVWRVA